jgi:uncharacterized protein
MPPSRRGRSNVEERVLAELASIRANVTGVHGSLAATIDGLLVAHDLPDADPAQIAALISSTFALASRATLMTGRGQFREAVTRGSEGYLAVYAAGRNAIVAVIGTSTLNVALLQYQVRSIIERVADYSDEFRKWSVPGPSPASGRAPSPAPASAPSPAPSPPPVPATGRGAGAGPAGGTNGARGTARARPDGATPLPVRRPGPRRSTSCRGGQIFARLPDPPGSRFHSRVRAQRFADLLTRGWVRLAGHLARARSNRTGTRPSTRA